MSNQLNIPLKMKKMTFRDYGSSLSNERTEFIQRIARITTCDPTTVSRWIKGDFIPSKRRREIIAKEMEIPEEILFPETTRATRFPKTIKAPKA